MKIGLSSYSLVQAIQKGEMDILGAIEWVAANGGEHIEISPSGFTLTDDPALVTKIVDRAREAGIGISSYTIGADLCKADDAAQKKEIERVKREVDVAHGLGVTRMRHDAASLPIPECGIARFDRELPRMAAACREIADYAKRFGITTSVENHGYFVQHSDRVQRLINAVGRDNFRTTLDVGNFICVDEDPVAAVRNNIPHASHVHFKDFYLRPFTADPGEGWARSLFGNAWRGAIVGQGDVDVRSIVKIIRESGYAGCASVEFEGMEDCRAGSRIGMDNLRRYWNEARVGRP
jgi:sugar phosphate isomerase/epimerase